MEIQIIRQRRKTLCLSINQSGKVVVKAPLHATAKVIEKFVFEKEQWIKKQTTELAIKKSFSDQFDFSSFVYILGKPIPFTELQLISNETFQVQPVYHLYWKKAEDYLFKRIQELSAATHISYNNVKLTKSRRIWGSFNRERNIKLNWRLIMLPPNLIDYVMIHELCHGKELNHSPRFWKLVENFIPNYKDAKKQIALYSFLLNEL